MAGLPDEEKYKWIEYYKAVFKADYYLPLDNQQKLILNARAAFGYLGFYNKDIGPSPFENFYVGGDGMTGYSFYGREVISLRGYTNGSLTPRVDKTDNGSTRRVEAGNVYSKLTLELRYPISLNPQATIYDWHSLRPEGHGMNSGLQPVQDEPLGWNRPARQPANVRAPWHRLGLRI
jgi:outer membrane protein insertion porin family